MKSKKLKKFCLAAMWFGIGYTLHAQRLPMSGPVNIVRDIVAVVGTIVPMVVGFMGLGRAAYKFAHGEPDSTTALLTAIVGYGLALVAITIA